MTKAKFFTSRAGWDNVANFHLLVSDHNEVRGLFERFEAAQEAEDADEMSRLATAIVEELEVHTTIEEEIDPSVGFVIPSKPGDRVRAGEPLASVFARNQAGIALGLEALREAIVIGDEGMLSPLISHRVAGDEGATMFERLAESRESFFGVLLQWSAG